MGLGAWGESHVTEADQVRAKARQKGTIDHVGRSCELCHDKISELEYGDPEMKMKGRSVLLGDIVRGQDFNWPVFLELGSSPPTIESAKALDAMGSRPGCRVQKTGDARGPIRDRYYEAPRRGSPYPKQAAETPARQISATSCAINFGPLRSCRRRRILGRTLRSATRVHCI